MNKQHKRIGIAAAWRGIMRRMDNPHADIYGYHDRFNERIIRRVSRVIQRALEAGKTVCEVYPGGNITPWSCANGGPSGFILPVRRPASVAEHVAKRVIGFGWGLEIR